MRVTETDKGLEIQWGNARGPLGNAFTVGKQSVVEASQAICEELDALSRWHISNERNADELGKLLGQLVEHGHSLHRALFDWGGRVMHKELLNWIAKSHARGDTELCITTDPSLDIPWGLTWDTRPERPWPKGRVVPSAFPHFWCHKYSLSTVFSDVAEPDEAVARQSFRMMSVLNKATYDSLQHSMEAERHADFKDIVERKHVGEAFEVSKLQQLIDDKSHRDTLLHFFCHATDRELDLGDERIDIALFRQFVDDLAEQSGQGASRNLIFLNACDTGRGELDYNFRSAGARAGYCGFIGTEAKVPKEFAAHFGHDLLRAIVMEGNSVGEALTKLRNDQAYWPLSLLYTCYVHPGYRIEPPTGLVDPLERILS